MENEPEADEPASTFRAFLELVRLPNIFTSMADVMMGFLITHELLKISQGEGITLGLLLAASGLLYAGGVALNDVCDIAIDAQERAYRPLPSGRIRLRTARTLAWLLLIAGVTVGWAASVHTHDFRCGLVATLLAGCIVLYDAVLKRTPLGPLAMGGCRMLNVLLGLSASVGRWGAEHWLVAAAIGIYIVGVTWFARREAGKSGRTQLTLAMFVMFAGVGLLGFLPRVAEDIPQILQQEPARWVLLIVALEVLVGFRCFGAISDPAPRRVQMAVKQCILALLFLDAAATFAVAGVAPAMLVLAMLIPAGVLGSWLYST